MKTDVNSEHQLFSILTLNHVRLHKKVHRKHTGRASKYLELKVSHQLWETKSGFDGYT